MTKLETSADEVVTVQFDSGPRLTVECRDLCDLSLEVGDHQWGAEMGIHVIDWRHLKDGRRYSVVITDNETGEEIVIRVQDSGIEVAGD